MKPIVLLGEAMGANEVITNTPFVGASGIELLRMLDESSIITLTTSDTDYIRQYYNTSDPQNIEMIWHMHPEVVRMNVFSQHPPANDILSFCGDRASALPGMPMLVKPSKFVRAEFAYELERLAEDINRIGPNLILALGNTPLWALCGLTGISKLRGTTRISTHTVADYKVLPTYHPAAVLRQWELRPIAIVDLMKAKREAEFPEIRRPAREIWIEPTISDIERFYNGYIRGCSLLSVDIETSGQQVTCLGLAPTTGLAIVIPFYDGRAKNRSFWNDAADELRAWAIIQQILGDCTIPKLFQNGMYDITFLWRSVGIKTFGACEDTMLLHHALQPEMLKGLAFLGSCYTDESGWKTDRKGNSTIKADA